MPLLVELAVSDKEYVFADFDPEQAENKPATTTTAASPIQARRRRTSGSARSASITATTGTISLTIFQPSKRCVDGGTSEDTETLIVKEFGAVVVGAEQLPFGIVVVQVKLTLGVKPVVAVKFALPLPELPVTLIEAGIVTEKSPPLPLS